MMTTDSGGARTHRFTAVRRDVEQVTPLELFFDLVFVLALTQCTALMAADPTGRGLVKGLLVLGVLWWAWVGYAWLTSVIDPEEGVVRLVIFGSMAAMLVVSLCVRGAYDELGLTFAVAYGVVRVAQLALLLVAGRDDPAMQRSVWTGLVPSTAAGIVLLAVASSVHGAVQGSLWATALGIDVLGPFLFGSSGWRLSPKHFAERHGLIIIIALGESIVAIGSGTKVGIDAALLAAAVLAMVLVAAMWWAYFDVSALGAERRLRAAAVGKEQNELARDAYSILHFVMVAGVVLMALGVKKVIGHAGGTLSPAVAFALVGGVAVYLLGLVGFRWRMVRSVSRPRVTVAFVLLALSPLADRPNAGVVLAVLAAAMASLIAYEVVHDADTRLRVRHGDDGLPTSP